MLFKNNKASVADAVLVPIYILSIACTMFVAFYVWTTFVTNFTPIATNTNITDTKNLTATLGEITTSISYLDYMFPFMVLGLLIVSLIFAYKTGASVIYAFVSVFMWILALIMSVVYETVFDQFAQQFTSIGTFFTITSYIMLNIKWICLVWAFLISTVMFTRNKSEDQNLAASERVFGR